MEFWGDSEEGIFLDLLEEARFVLLGEIEPKSNVIFAISRPECDSTSQERTDNSRARVAEGSKNVEHEFDRLFSLMYFSRRWDGRESKIIRPPGPSHFRISFARDEESFIAVS